MRFLRASNIGFCFGVQRAYNIIRDRRKKFIPPVRILGDLVHNSHIIKELDEWGIERVLDVSGIKDGTLIVPAHGCDPALVISLCRKGVAVINTTCPKVGRAIAEAQKLKREGFSVIILGDKDHSEVRAINGALRGEGFICSSVEEAGKAAKKLIKAHKVPGLISQTTQNTEVFQELKKVLSALCSNAKVIDTICTATYDRQQEVRRMAVEADVMIIIGTSTSANSSRLMEISRERNKRTYFVDTVAELRREWFLPGDLVGLATGASTPEAVIESIAARISALTGGNKGKEPYCRQK